MSSSHRAAAACLATCLWLVTGTAPAGAPTARTPSRADFNGLWSTEQGILWDTAVSRGQQENPPFTAEYATLYKQALEAAANGRPPADPPASCLPPGTPRIMASPFPIEIVVTPAVVYMLFEYMSQIRRVFTDSNAPKSLGLPTFNGYSTGRWEGNDLLIDTVDMRGDTVLDTTHLGHSEQLQVHERLHLRATDKLEAVTPGPLRKHAASETAGTAARAARAARLEGRASSLMPGC